MSQIVTQMVLTTISLAPEGKCTHDIYEGVGGEETIPRKKLFPLLKLLERTGKLDRSHGEDSRGKFGFKWTVI